MGNESIPIFRGFNSILGNIFLSRKMGESWEGIFHVIPMTGATPADDQKAFCPGPGSSLGEWDRGFSIADVEGKSAYTAGQAKEL